MNATIKMNLSLFSKAVSVFALSGFLFACASIEAEKVTNQEQLLTSAGFTKKLPDTPEKLAHLKSLSQHKLVAHEKNGKNYYYYADVTTCQCLYLGGEKEYQSYQKLQVAQNIADDQKMNAEMQLDTDLSPWGFYGNY